MRERVKRMLKKHGLSGVNKPKKTPSHPKKSHMVLAKEGDKVKLIRFGEQGAKTAGKPKAGESDKMNLSHPCIIQLAFASPGWTREDITTYFF